MFSSKEVSAARSVLQEECAFQFVRLHDQVWMQSPFERVGAVNLLLVIVIIISWLRCQSRSGFKTTLYHFFYI